MKNKTVTNTKGEKFIVRYRLDEAAMERFYCAQWDLTYYHSLLSAGIIAQYALVDSDRYVHCGYELKNGAITTKPLGVREPEPAPPMTEEAKAKLKEINKEKAKRKAESGN